MKAVIYARYSSDNQREESIEGQIRECTTFAEKNGITILKHYIDRAYSAKTDNRPEFQRMINDSRQRLFDIVLVWKLDRFARNRYDSANYENSLGCPKFDRDSHTRKANWFLNDSVVRGVRSPLQIPICLFSGSSLGAFLVKAFQRFPVQLAVGGIGHGIQLADHIGDHISGKLPLEESCQISRDALPGVIEDDFLFLPVK